MKDAGLEMEARELALSWLRARLGADHPLPNAGNSGRAKLRLFESLTQTAREELLKARAAQAVGKRYVPVRPNFTIGDHMASLLRMVTRYMGGKG